MCQGAVLGDMWVLQIPFGPPLTSHDAPLVALLSTCTSARFGETEPLARFNGAQQAHRLSRQAFPHASSYSIGGAALRYPFPLCLILI